MRQSPPLRLSSAADHLHRRRAEPLSALDPTRLRTDLLRCRCKITGAAPLLIHRTHHLRCTGRPRTSETLAESGTIHGRCAQSSPMCSSSSARDQLSCLSSTRRVSPPIASFTGVAGMLATPADGSSLSSAVACRHQRQRPAAVRRAHTAVARERVLSAGARSASLVPGIRPQ